MDLPIQMCVLLAQYSILSHCTQLFLISGIFFNQVQCTTTQSQQTCSTQISVSHSTHITHGPWSSTRPRSCPRHWFLIFFVHLIIIIIIIIIINETYKAHWYVAFGRSPSYNTHPSSREILNYSLKAWTQFHSWLCRTFA